MAQQSFSANNKIAQVTQPTPASMQSQARSDLTGWVMTNVQQWEQHRNTQFEQRWNQYYRLWRGFWTADDKTRTSERSRIVTPFTMQAVETLVSELEDAVLSREYWFDLSDDFMDSQVKPLLQVAANAADVAENPDLADQALERAEGLLGVRELLTEDMDRVDIRTAIVECFLNAAIYGTGIAKILVDKINVVKPTTSFNVDDQGEAKGLTKAKRTAVFVEPISPTEFVIDPAVNKSGKEGIDMALGCAHILERPRWSIIAKQENGTYYVGQVGSPPDVRIPRDNEEVSNRDKTNVIKIVEYYGKVPRPLLEAAREDEDETVEWTEDDMVEAKIVIANDTFLLQAEKNSSLQEDRPIVAFSFDIVPGRFWGRGVAEKAFNAQKANDAMVRARIDGLALTVHPMMAGDVTKLVKNQNLRVFPGNFIMTQGNPNEVLSPFNFGRIDPTVYTETSDLERQVTVATGAQDSAAPLRTNRRNETARGLSMILGSMLKRTKRTLRRIEHEFLVPLITKVLWRYMQFAKDRYPAADYSFVVRSGLGMAAREIEFEQYVELMRVIPPDHPGFGPLLEGIIDLSSIAHREKIKNAIKQAQQTPPDPRRVQMQQQLEELALRRAEAEVRDIETRAEENQAQAAKLRRETGE